MAAQDDSDFFAFLCRCAKLSTQQPGRQRPSGGISRFQRNMLHLFISLLQQRTEDIINVSPDF